MAEKESREIARRATEELANFLLTKSQENLIEDGAVDTAFLLRSGNVKKEEFFIVEYGAPYAAAIEFGTDPHTINPKILEPWVRRKLGIKNPQAIRKTAFLIARAIRERGTEPREFMQKAIESAKKEFRVKI